MPIILTIIKTWYDDFTNRYYNVYGEEYVSPDYLKDNSPANINVYSLTADYTMPTKKSQMGNGHKKLLIPSLTMTLPGKQIPVIAGKLMQEKTNHFIYKENVNAAYV